MRNVFVDEVSKLLRQDEKTVLLLGDIGVYGFREVFQEFPNRVHNVGILEQSMISMAGGLASEGLFPIVHTIAPFMTLRALEQI